MNEKQYNGGLAERRLSNDSSDGPLQTNEFAHLTLWQSMKKWRKVVFVCLGMTTAILMYGYDYVIVGTVSAMPSFQADFGEKLGGQWIIPSMWLGLWNFISPGCQMIGAIAGGFFQDRFGRRPSLGLASLLCAVGVAVCFVSNRAETIDARRGIFLAGKGFQGGAIGMAMATTQTYMSEILPPNLRGPLLAFMPIFALVGQLIGAGVIFGLLSVENGYTICFATQWPISALPFIMSFIIPESPAYLVRKGRIEDARKSQAKLERDPVADAEDSLNVLRANIEHEQRSAQPTYRDSFRKGNLRRTLIITFANILPQLFGFQLISKSSYFLQIVGLNPKSSIMMLIIGVIAALAANIASMWMLARFGRRPLILCTLSVAAVLWASMGVAGIYPGSISAWYTAISMTSVVVVCSLGVWPTSYVISAETSALHLRAKAQGIGWFTNGIGSAIFGFFIPFLFNPDQGNLKAKIGFVIAGLSVIGVVSSYYVVPEMKGRTTAEIDRMFELKLSARDFADWKNPRANGEIMSRGEHQT